MKKKLRIVLCLMILILSVIPSTVFAYTGGLLNGLPMNTGSDENNIITSGITQWTDNTTTTTYTLAIYSASSASRDTAWYEFTDLKTVSRYKLYSNQASLVVKLYDSSGAVLYTSPTNTAQADINLATPIDNVKKVAVINTAGGMTLNEFDVFGTASATDTTPPADVTNLNATNITKTTLNVNFTAPTTTDYDKFKIYRNSSLIYTSSSGQAKGASLTYTDGSLVAGTSYTYKVTTLDTTGNESIGAGMTASTLPNDTTPPSTITDLRASPLNGHTVLNWSAAVDPQGSAVSYDVFVDGVKKTATKITDLTYDVTVTTDANHSYYVVAYDADLNASAHSNTVTTYFDTISPMAPIGLTLNGKPSDIGNSTQITLNWTASTEPDLAGYNVYQLPSTKMNGALITATSYTVTGLTTNQKYEFAITAVDTANNESVQSSTVSYTFDNIAPLNVTGLTVTGSDQKANINFNVSASTDIAGYKIYRNGMYLTTITGTNYQDLNLTNGTSYAYSISSIDLAGNESARSSDVSVVPAVPLEVPAAPSSVGVVVRNGALMINWSAVSSANSYNIYLNGTKYNAGTVTSTTYGATGLTNGTNYTIEISAVNAVGEGPLSTAINATPNEKSLPYITYNYSLKDVADSVDSVFSSYWMILAFSLAIPLSFYVGRRIKEFFIG